MKGDSNRDCKRSRPSCRLVARVETKGYQEWLFSRKRAGGYLLREAPAADLKQMKILFGHLKEGQFITKFRKTFTKAEMNDDLLVVPAKLGGAEDRSEYEEILPTSPPGASGAT